MRICREWCCYSLSLPRGEFMVFIWSLDSVNTANFGIGIYVGKYLQVEDDFHCLLRIILLGLWVVS